jgi:hypothetical protein
MNFFFIGFEIGWSTHGSSDFKMFITPLNWTKAQAWCQLKNSNLASIHDIETNRFVNNLPTSKGALWIGGSREVGITSKHMTNP